MLTKIQKLTVFLVALGLVTTSLALFTSPKVYADYTVGAGQKCQDNSNPTTVNNAGAVTYSCADSTKTGGTNPNAGGSGQGANNNNSTSCAVEKIGWILCPIIEGSAKVADKLFQFLADHFLETEPELLSDSSGTKKAWDQAIMLANIMFVIAFIVVIYSQITGAGLSNYGIKRMLPRLILAAVMVNLSFYICQAMADLSNLLGYEIMTIMTDLAKNAGPSVMMQADNQGLNTQTSDGILAKVAVGALAVGGLVWMFLAPMGGIILMVLITCLITIILLLLRKALIVLLVVVSPFAFVAYLLPNTEKLFNKWLDMYWKLLLVFPIVATLLGSGQLASAIILTAGIQAGNTGSTSQNCDTNSPDSQKVKGGGLSVPCEGSVDLDGGTSGQGRKAGWMLALVATGVAVGPVLAAASVIAALIKTSGAIAGKVGAAVQSGAAGGVKGTAGWLGKNTAFGRGLAARRAGQQAYRDQQFVNRMSDTRGGIRGLRGRATRTMARGVGGNVGMAAGAVSPHLGARSRGALNAATGGMQAQNSRLAANVAGAAAKAEKDEIQAAHAVIDRLDGNESEAQAQRLIQGGDFDSPHLAALLEHIAAIDKQAFMRLGSQLGGRESVATRAASGVMSSMGGFYGGGDAARMQRGEIMNLQDVARNNIANGSMSANNIASLSNDGVQALGQLTNDAAPAVQAQMRTRIGAAEGQLSMDQRGNLSGQKQGNLTNIVNGTWRPPPAP